MIITSSQQLEELYNPSEKINMDEFEELTLKVGSFICISKTIKIDNRRQKNSKNLFLNIRRK